MKSKIFIEKLLQNPDIIEDILKKTLVRFQFQCFGIALNTKAPSRNFRMELFLFFAYNDIKIQGICKLL